MNTFAEQSSGKKSVAAANLPQDRKEEDAVMPAKPGSLQEVADKSKQVKQLRAIQQMIDSSIGVQRRSMVPPVIQRVKKTESQAREHIAEAMPELVGKDVTFIELFDTETMNNANCHGYTINGDSSTSAGTSELADHIVRNKAKGIVVFTKGGAVGHSGLVKGANIVQFLIGVGVNEMKISDVSAAYDETYILPDERTELFTDLEWNDMSDPEITFWDNVNAFLKKHRDAIEFPETDRDEEIRKAGQAIDAMTYSVDNAAKVLEYMEEFK